VNWNSKAFSRHGRPRNRESPSGRSVGHHADQAPLPQPKREIRGPEEPSKALSVTLFDMLRTFEQIIGKTRKSPVPRSSK
jgi:hypothetical protein